MGDDPDLARLRSLEERLAKATEKPAEPQPKTGTSFSQGELAWRMVIELVTGMLLGLAIGYGLDTLFGTMPIFLVIFALFGFAAGIRTMMGTAKQLTGQAASKAGDEGDRRGG
ncbi:MAG: AtpZ/AtpI family protein [bacterium]